MGNTSSHEGVQPKSYETTTTPMDDDTDKQSQSKFYETPPPSTQERYSQLTRENPFSIESPPRVVKQKQTRERLRCIGCGSQCDQPKSDKVWDDMFEMAKKDKYYIQALAEGKTEEESIKITVLRMINDKKNLLEIELLKAINMYKIENEKWNKSDGAENHESHNIMEKLEENMDLYNKRITKLENIITNINTETFDSLLKMGFGHCPIYCNKTCEALSKMKDDERNDEMMRRQNQVTQIQSSPESFETNDDGQALLGSSSPSFPSSPHAPFASSLLEDTSTEVAHKARSRAVAVNTNQTKGKKKFEIIARKNKEQEKKKKQILEKKGGKKKRKRKTKKKKNKKMGYRGKSPKKKKTKKHRGKSPKKKRTKKKRKGKRKKMTRKRR